jgi:hypothetical protein
MSVPAFSERTTRAFLVRTSTRAERRAPGDARRRMTRAHAPGMATTAHHAYWDWYLSKAYLLLAAQSLVARFLETFKDYPPRQQAASFTINVMEKLERSPSSANK